METSKLTHKVCGQTIIVQYRSTMGHGLTDRALAEYNAILKHKCPKEK